FYQNQDFTDEEGKIIQQGNTLAKVIKLNTPVTNLQGNVFRFKASISGTVFKDSNGDGQQENNEPGISGVTVQLQDTSGDILATTTTDNNGNFRFNQLSGPSANPDISSGVSATGDYNVVILGPTGMRQTTPNPGTILISRGSTDVIGVNFGLQPVK